MTILAKPGHAANLSRFAALALLAGSLTACNVLNRVGDIGAAPQLNPIENPVTAPSYRSVSMPMPEPERPSHMANSLWRPGRPRLLQGSARGQGRRHPDSDGVDRGRGRDRELDDPQPHQ
jgi:hypothetical protein